VLSYRLRPGELTREEAAGATFRTPSGAEIPAAYEGGGELTYSGTDEVGVYELSAGGQVRARFAVGVLSASETDLEPAQDIDFGEFTVDVEAEVEQGNREVWKWFALGALVFLLLEWFAYHRRVG
jgi:hypothetical protein